MTTPSGTTANITGRVYARRIHYAKGYWYVWYYGTDGIYWASTSDDDCLDSSFSSGSSMGFSSGLVNDMSVAFDGTYFHVAYLNSTTDVKYRRGTPDGAGGITWDSAVTAATSTSVRVCSICVSSDSHVWIAFGGGSSFHARVVRNANTTSSSTWSNDTAFPSSGGKQISSSAVSTIYDQVVPMNDGTCYVAWVTASGGTMYGRTCASDGTLGSIETISTTSPADNFGWSLASFGNEVYAVWEGLATYYYTYYRHRSSAGSWDSAIQIGGGSGIGADNVTPGLSVNQDTGDVFVWFRDNDNWHLYYRKYNYGTGLWDSTVDFGALESSGDMGYLSVTPVAYHDRVAAMTGYGSSPYYIGTIVVSSPGGTGTGPSGGCMMFGGLGMI